MHHGMLELWSRRTTAKGGESDAYRCKFYGLQRQRESGSTKCVNQ
jgi:hypothetical protein